MHLNSHYLGIFLSILFKTLCNIINIHNIFLMCVTGKYYAKDGDNFLRKSLYIILIVIRMEIFEFQAME